MYVIVLYIGVWMLWDVLPNAVFKVGETAHVFRLTRIAVLPPPPCFSLSLSLSLFFSPFPWITISQSCLLSAVRDAAFMEVKSTTTCARNATRALRWPTTKTMTRNR